MKSLCLISYQTVISIQNLSMCMNVRENVINFEVGLSISFFYENTSFVCTYVSEVTSLSFLEIAEETSETEKNDQTILILFIIMYSFRFVISS